MKKFLAIVGMVGLLGMNVGTVLAASNLSGVAAGVQAGSALVSGTAGTATYLVTVSRTGSGSLGITLSTSGLPVGASASFSPAISFTGGTPTSASSTLTITTTSGVSAGTTAFTIYAVGGGATTTTTANLTVGSAAVVKTNPTLSISNSPVTYNAAAQSATVAGSVAGVVSNVMYNGSATVPTNAGTYAVTANFVPTNTTNYNSLTNASAGNFVISNRAVTVTADAKVKTVGDADPALTYQITSGTLAGSDAFSGALTRAVGTTAGSYAITQGTLVLNSNYTLSYVGANLTINAAPVVDTTAPAITLTGSAIVNMNVGQTYTEAGATATDNVDSNVTVNVTGTVDTATVGVYTITYTATDSSNNTATTTRTVNVTAVPVSSYTITASAGSNGSISPTGSVPVSTGADQSFIITANSTYHIADVTVDSVSVGATSTYLFSSVAATHTIAATFAANAPVATVEACVATSTFDGFNLGTVNNQGGWGITNSTDQAVTENTYGFPTLGCKVLRISDAVTSGGFGDQLFTPSTTNEAGEMDATSTTLSGGARKSHFEAQFDLASVMPTEQTGMHFSVSPDRGDGARMSYLRFEDGSNGINVFFNDVEGMITDGTDGCTVSSPCANFVDTQIATLDRSAPHTVKFSMDFVNGPSNDIVKIFIDGDLVHTGTSWEDYFRFDPESNPALVSESRTVDSLLFRESATSTPSHAGNGYLLDNVSLSTSNIPVITLNGSNTLLLTQNYAGYVDPMATASDAIDGDLTVSADTPLTTDAIGSYVITYTATSSDHIAASVSRTVTIIPQAGGAGGANGVPGCLDPKALNYDATAIYAGTCTYTPAGEVLGDSTTTLPGGSTTTPVIVTVSTSTPGQVLGAAMYNFTRDLRFTLTGNDVTELQKLMMALGYMANDTPTKYFGTLTRSAVAKWQAANGIKPALGYFGPISRAFLMK